MYYHYPYGYKDVVIPTLTFAQAKAYFEPAFLAHYGQAVGVIDEDTSYYSNGRWLFNSPLHTADNKTVTNYGQFRDRTDVKYQPYGSIFTSEIVPIYPG